MADNIGWISLHRQIQSHWIWQDANKLKWWLDMLMTVNSNPAKVNLGNEIYECGRGESLISLQGWGARWGVSKDAARNFIKLLEKDNMIRCVNIGKSTRISVCNYDSYQGGLHVNPTQTQRKPNANPTQSHPNNNDNKEIISFDSFYELYGKKVSRVKSEEKWKTISNTDKILIMKHIPKYKLSQPESKFRKDPITYLNNKTWLDDFEAPQQALFKRQTNIDNSNVSN